MLQLYKNSVVTEASLSHADVRQRELDFYTNNYWTWGGTATTMAGFVFTQLTNPTPDDTDIYLDSFYLLCTSLCLGLNLCIITWTVLCCTWGPGLALRGANGMKSFHHAVDFLKGEQHSIHIAFGLSVVTFFLSACCIVWVYPSRTMVNTACTGVLLFFLVLIVALQIRLEFQIGGSLFRHEGPDGRLQGLEKFEDVADIDNFIAASLPPEAAAASTTLHPGMYGTQAPGAYSEVSYGYRR
mmetsp:Transcript_109172/g.315427  ORF Transcript_109172/g.315427 Transcript_109172/m.315427 type:complete len:241 (+) Transcript_109172:161-883(+)